MIQARQHEKKVEEEKMQERHHEYQNLKHGLYGQMEDKQRRKEEAREEYLKERDQVNAAAEKIHQEDLQ